MTTLENTLIHDLEIPYVDERRFLRKIKRPQTELLAEKLKELGFSTDFSGGNTSYHGLESVDVLISILEAKAVLGPTLVEDYCKAIQNNEEYQFPEQKAMIGNPPNYGEFAGFTNFGHALHVAINNPMLSPEDVFNNRETILLGFKASHIHLIYSINHMQIEDPEIGLGV